MKKLAYLAAGLLFVSATAAQAAKPESNLFEFVLIKLDASASSGSTLGISPDYVLPAGKRLFIDDVGCGGTTDQPAGGAQISSIILRTEQVGVGGVFVLVTMANTLSSPTGGIQAHEQTSTFLDDNVTTTNQMDMAFRRTSSFGSARVVCYVSGRLEDHNPQGNQSAAFVGTDNRGEDLAITDVTVAAGTVEVATAGGDVLWSRMQDAEVFATDATLVTVEVLLVDEINDVALPVPVATEDTVIVPAGLAPGEADTAVPSSITDRLGDDIFLDVLFIVQRWPASLKRVHVDWANPDSVHMRLPQHAIHSGEIEGYVRFWHLADI